jgi:hypothetical protein
LCEKPHVLWWGGPDTGVARLLVKHVTASCLVSAARRFASLSETGLLSA